MGVTCSQTTDETAHGRSSHFPRIARRRTSLAGTNRTVVVRHNGKTYPTGLPVIIRNISLYGLEKLLRRKTELVLVTLPVYPSQSLFRHFARKDAPKVMPPKSPVVVHMMGSRDRHQFGVCVGRRIYSPVFKSKIAFGMRYVYHGRR